MSLWFKTPLLQEPEATAHDSKICCSFEANQLKFGGHLPPATQSENEGTKWADHRDSSLFFCVNPEVLSSWEASMIQKTLLYTSTFESQPFCTMSCGLVGVPCVLSCEDKLSRSFKAAAHWARVWGGSIMIAFLPTIYRGFTKGWYSKKVVLAEVPPQRKRKPERGYMRQNHPFTKPPFCLLSKPTGVLRPPGPKIPNNSKEKGLLMPSGLECHSPTRVEIRKSPKFTFKSAFFSDISASSDFFDTLGRKAQQQDSSFKTLSGFLRPGPTGDSEK